MRKRSANWLSCSVTVKSNRVWRGSNPNEIPEQERSMWSFLVSPEFELFSIAALVMIGLFVVETASTLLGASASTLLDTAFGLHGVHVELDHGIESHGTELAANDGIVHGPDGPFATAFDWLNAGRVPLLVLMIAAIACFAVVGMVLQIVAMHLVAPLPPAVAATIAIVATVPGTRWIARWCRG